MATKKSDKPHMMYFKGQSKLAKNNAEHLALKKKGWGHTKPKTKK